MGNFKARIKKMWDEEPEKVIGIAVVVTLVALKGIQMWDDHKRTVTYDREIDRRRYMAGML